MDKKLRALKMNLKLDSSRGRVIDMMVRFQNLVDENGWHDAFEGDDGQKRKAKYLLNAIEPAGLKELMKRVVQRQPKFLSRPMALGVVLEEKAESWDEVIGIANSLQQQPNRPMKKRNRPGQVKNEGGEEKRKKPKNEEEATKDKGKKLKCFNCVEVGHPAFKCPAKLSKDEVFQLLKKKDNKYTKPSKYPFVCRLGSRVDEGKQVEVRISDSLYFPAILDSGATDVSLIPRGIADQAMEKDPTIERETMSEPVTLRLGDNVTEVLATEAVTVDLCLRTCAGEVVMWLIWDVPSDEIILGSNLLKELGIEPKTALDVLIRRHGASDDETESQTEIEEPSGTVRRVGGHREESAMLARTHCGVRSDVKLEVDAMLKRAEDNGLPPEWRNKLEDLVYRYKDAWQVRLGPEPPAKVEPFVTELKPNAEPVKCKARQYKPEDSEFLQNFIDELLKYGLV
jgi:hypothetical protein